MKNKELIFEGIEEGYKVYKNKDGFMEGYKTKGNSKYGKDEKYIGGDMERIVSNQKTIGGFGNYVRGFKKPRIRRVAADQPKLFIE